jgi:23S rRNA pseudouridine955/2504/2580 synthase
MNSTRQAGDGGRQTGVRRVRVDADQAGQRIDNFLRRELPGLPRSRLYRVLRKGEVRVNGGRVKAEYRLVEGDEVRIPPARIDPGPGEPPAGKVTEIASQIIYEDKRILVINKASGLAAHGGSGISHGAIELLRAARPELRDLSLVHRLDRDTSGCLVLAKKRSALRALHEKFRDQDVEKNYLALVAGDWQHGDRVIDAPLLVEHRKKGERHVVVSGAGKAARTRFRLSRTFGEFSLVQCQPETGRTHQIRVHALHAGHPVVGDDRYGDPAANSAAKKLGLKRLFLHAQSIAFPDDSGNELHFTAPLPAELQRFLDAITGGRRRQGSR